MTSWQRCMNSMWALRRKSGNFDGVNFDCQNARKPGKFRRGFAYGRVLDAQSYTFISKKKHGKNEKRTDCKKRSQNRWSCNNPLTRSPIARQAVFPLRCETAQWNLILAHLQHSEFITIHTYRIALLMLGTLHFLCVCMVVQLHAFRAQHNKHLLSVEFS